MLTKPRLTKRQRRGSAEIAKFDLEIDYLPGPKNYIQDAPNRCQDYKEPPIPLMK
jgi:hypothetical protein